MVAQVWSMPDGEWRAFGVVIVAVLMVLIVLSVGLVVSFLRHITRRPPR